MSKQNGVAKPREGSKSARVWEIADQFDAETSEETMRAELIKEAADINPATVSTQIGRWRKYHGLTKAKAKA